MATAFTGKLFIVNKALCADKYTATLTSCAYSYLSTEEKTMQKTVLNDVFELLQQIGAVSSESEFSRDWLCRSECYVRTLRFKRVKPSVGTLAICASKLQPNNLVIRNWVLSVKISCSSFQWWSTFHS